MPTTYAIPDGRTVMAATLYTGTGATQTISNSANGVSFQPDLVWVKGRSGATDHAWYDAVRGVQNQLESNTTTAETTETTGLTAFGSSGFTVGALAQMNTSSATYVGWQWNAGGSTVTNTSGSISAQVRANTTAGFSVVTYTGTGVTATIGHGLGVAPQMIIVKNRAAAESWRVGHSFMNNGSSPWNYYMNLNGTAAQTASSAMWNNTAPSSTVFTISNDSAVSGNGQSHVAYCFAPVAGYSAFGYYTGNGSADGPFIYTGFRPRWIITKSSTLTTGASVWVIADSSRLGYNADNATLNANETDAENNSQRLDILSNGFKQRTSPTSSNGAGQDYIYMAFAENPFKYANAR